MSFKTVVSILFLLSLQTLSLPTASASDGKTCTAFDRATRLAYIERTSISGSSLESSGSAIGLAGGFLAPKALRGINIPNAEWKRPPTAIIGQSQVSLEVEGPWGWARLIVQSDEMTGLSLELRPASTGEILNTEQIKTLKGLYPSLTVKSRPPRTDIRLMLSAYDSESPESFVAEARSFVNTVFNDPLGLMKLYTAANENTQGSK